MIKVEKTHVEKKKSKQLTTKWDKVKKAKPDRLERRLEDLVSGLRNKKHLDQVLKNRWINPRERVTLDINISDCLNAYKSFPVELDYVKGISLIFNMPSIKDWKTAGKVPAKSSVMEFSEFLGVDPDALLDSPDTVRELIKKKKLKGVDFSKMK